MTETTVTVERSSGPLKPNIAALKSIPGILRIVAIVLSIIVFICLGSTPYSAGSHGGFIWFTAVASLICAIVLLCVWVLRINERVPKVPWLLVELIVSVIWAVCFLISGALACDRAVSYSNLYKHGVGDTRNFRDGTNSHRYAWSKARDCFAACAFFCFVAMIVWAVNAFLHFKAWKGTKSVKIPGTNTTVTMNT